MTTHTHTHTHTISLSHTLTLSLSLTHTLGRERSDDWALHKWFDTEEAGIWSLVVCKGRLISGGVDGTVTVWI